MHRHARVFIALGAISAAASVVLGAIGSHSANPHLTQSLPLFQTALQYQQLHAVGLILVGLIMDKVPSRWLILSGLLMVLGTILFSVNIYLRSLAGIDAFRALTPFGGGAFIVAWVMLAIGVLTKSNANQNQ